MDGGTVLSVQGIGIIDESGRLRLLGAGAAGAAFGVVLVVLLVSSFTPATTGTVVAVGIPGGVVGATAGVLLTLRSWRLDGGYDRVVTVQRWIDERRVPAGVPAEVWVPLLQAQADREGAGWTKVVLGVFWVAMTLSVRGQHGVVVTGMLVALWAGMGLWGGLVAVPRARAARAVLRRGVTTAADGTAG